MFYDVEVVDPACSCREGERNDQDDMLEGERADEFVARDQEVCRILGEWAGGVRGSHVGKRARTVVKCRMEERSG